MKKIRSLLQIFTLVFLLTGVSSAVLYPVHPSVEFYQRSYLRIDNISVFDLDYAIASSDSATGVYIAPQDAIMIHVIVNKDIKDILIVSDMVMNRLLIWQLTTPDQNSERQIEYVTEYEGHDCDGQRLKAPSGLETNAHNRLFDPGKDVIYVADRGNGRIVELAYIPDSTGGNLYFNRAIGRGYLHYPLDIAISAYGETHRSIADLYVVDIGTFNNDGALFRFNLSGILEGTWRDICFDHGSESIVQLERPKSVACYPDTVPGYTHIYITEENANEIILLRSSTDSKPFFEYQIGLNHNGEFYKPEGVAIDDFGRVYVANYATCQIEIFDYYLDYIYQPFGDFGHVVPKLFYPRNMLIDTFYDEAEALFIEQYCRESGFQSYVLDGAWSPEKPALGFQGAGLLKPHLQHLASLPSRVTLHDVYPNPFNANCTIAYDLPSASHVLLEVFNVLGQRVAIIEDKHKEAGYHHVVFDAGDLASGMYLYKISVDNHTQVKKAILLK